MKELTLTSLCMYLCVANSWNPGDAFTAFPCTGTESIRDSSNGISTEITSMGARSISSRRIQNPPRTACNRGPGCQANSPGVSVDTYVPSKDLKAKKMLFYSVSFCVFFVHFKFICYINICPLWLSIYLDKSNRGNFRIIFFTNQLCYKSKHLDSYVYDLIYIVVVNNILYSNKYYWISIAFML